MPKPIVKDIQIKKKPNVVPQEKRTSVIDVPTLSKETPIDNKQVYKKNKKSRKIFWFLFCIVLLSCFILFYFTKTIITITPKISERTINTNITLVSWNEPFRTSVMEITEKTPLLDDIDQSKKILSEKTKNDFQYDTPKDYYIPTNCILDPIYTVDDSPDDVEKFITSKTSALIIHKEDFLTYIKKVLVIDNEDIKNIDDLRCTLKTDITKYTIGQKTQDLTVNISGTIKTEFIINNESLINSIKSQFKNKADFILENNPVILNYSINLKPLNFFPLISSKSKNIEIKIQSLLEY